MGMNFAAPQGKQQGGIDRVKLRLAVLGILVVVAFVALFSRLWFLQVLASTTYKDLAQENRVRLVHSEPSRGRILDREGRVIVRNRGSNSVTIDRQVIEPGSKKEDKLLRRLSKLLDEPREDLIERLNDATVSPYKPVAVAFDVKERHSTYIAENQEDFPGVDTEVLPIRYYPHGALAAHILGYVGEISPEELKSDHFKSERRPYLAGDLVGKDGLEYAYDRYLRGRPRIEKKIVNSANQVVGSRIQQQEIPGRDLVTSLDVDIQKVTERSLHAGIMAARSAGYNAPAGAALVLEPETGAVVAMASLPEFDPSILADGILQKEYDALGGATPNEPDDDALLNRATQAQRKPGSTFKLVTAGAALATDVANPYSVFECPGARTYGDITFHNWTSAYRGYIGFPESLEHSCNTFYYELGWRMESEYGVVFGDETERFQKYARRAGLGHETGIDLRYEAEGLVPDRRWCRTMQRNVDENWCLGADWLPGYTVNMSIGQGDLLVTPLQMGVTYAAVGNGGEVVQPRIGWKLATPGEDGATEIVREFKPNVVTRLPLEDAEIAVLKQGLEQVVTGGSGTAVSTFAGFPLDRYPVVGKTGTAQLRSGSTTLNDAWFVSFSPKENPEYLVAVYLEEAGHGGTSAGPVARQIWEGIYEIDQKTDVLLAQDFSG